MRKKVNLLLFIFLLILWCLVIYKYFGLFFFQNEDVKGYEASRSNVSLRMREKDTFELLPLTKNPFTGHNTIKTQKSVMPNNRRRVSNNIKIPKKIAASFEFPNIEYYGYIQSQNRETPLILIKINQKLFKLKLGQVQNEVTVLKANKDSVLVSFMKTKKSIKKVNNSMLK